MVAVESMSQPMHVAAVLILSPPAEAGPEYVDDLYREALSARDPIDPRLCRYPHRGRDTGEIWVWRDAENLDISHLSDKPVRAAIAATMRRTSMPTPTSPTR
jgi:diacylglycerol O-acyltransferase